MTNDQLFVLAILGMFVTPIFGLITSYIQRRRDIADRKKARAELEADRITAKAELENVRKEVVKTGVASAAAEKAANHGNEKIAALQTALTKALNLPDVPITLATIEAQEVSEKSVDG